MWKKPHSINRFIEDHSTESSSLYIRPNQAPFRLNHVSKAEKTHEIWHRTVYHHQLFSPLFLMLFLQGSTFSVRARLSILYNFTHARATRELFIVPPPLARHLVAESGGQCAVSCPLTTAPSNITPAPQQILSSTVKCLIKSSCEENPPSSGGITSAAAPTSSGSSNIWSWIWTSSRAALINKASCHN